ncbi:glycoside hydrolase family 3 protein [Hyunsoonleella aestuarii]|uniref:beta-glucosidase n=1 Tax=Hyunsoonleella aestuarii TaxID=912802 RepID=A0ABP8E6W4_9FLAO|nr:glycoside hydrolase family 3 N-terminal domain-containing protein [Hyunsoonleella aestuarii]
MSKIKVYYIMSAFLSINIGCQNLNQITGNRKIPAIALEKSSVKTEIAGRVYRDLNNNGKLDIYEDINQPIEARIKDLMSQMNLKEKAGMMFIDGAPVSEDGTLESKKGVTGPAARRPPAIQNIDESLMNHFNVWGLPDNVHTIATWYNKLQQYAEKTRLGIPVTIASDPRHHFSKNIFSLDARGFSQFCETTGLAAIGDEKLMNDFAEIVRQEYLAVGIREALHPQIDLATEPRWPRINGGFGEDAKLSAKLAKTYIEVMQGGKSLSENGIACMTKHFPGGGPQKNGLDPHFEFQQGQIYPGENFDYHLIPFEAAFEANTSAIMPYYGIPVGQTDEDVAMSFNKMIITELLRKKYNFEGIVCADWGCITDVPLGPDVVWPARAWGVEHLSEVDRTLKIIEAGCDQFGGEARPELVIQLVKDGKLSEERIDTSIKRLLRQKFQLGLFDNPFVDESKVNEIVGKEEFVQLGIQSQQRSMTLLKNDGSTLPLSINNLKIYIENMDSTIVSEYATVVNTPEEADFAIIRLNTPWYPVETNNFIARGFHHGDLDFKREEKEKILQLLKTVPTIVNIYLDRPAVIPEIANRSKVLIADFGASDKSVCEVLFGNTSPEGKLPFELPSSMEAVANQKTDVPYDSENPLFRFGFGIKYIK